MFILCIKFPKYKKDLPTLTILTFFLNKLNVSLIGYFEMYMIENAPFNYGIIKCTMEWLAIM